MEPTFKAPSLDAFLAEMMGVSRTDTVRNGNCVSCTTTDISETSFRDDVSRKEYTISGLCQTCQDDVFGEDDV